MIKFLILLIMLLQGVAYAYIDSDFDGVADRYDACPHTPFSDLVDAQGCTIQKVPLAKEVARISLLVGTSYSRYTNSTNKTTLLSQSLELDYEINKIKLQLQLSHHNSKNTTYTHFNDASFGDTRVLMQYALEPFMPQLALSVSAGVSIPSYKGVMKNNKLDILTGINATYFIEKFSLFTGSTYTLIGDDDTDYAHYQNTLALNLGIGYSLSPTLYSSLSYFWSQSSITSEDNAQTLSWFGYLTINPKLFTTFSLSKDLDAHRESGHYTLTLGYHI